MGAVEWGRDDRDCVLDQTLLGLLRASFSTSPGFGASVSVPLTIVQVNQNPHIAI